MQILMLCHDLASNALGRAYSLWLLCQELGWQSEVVGPSYGPPWSPLARTPFADACHVLPRGHHRQVREHARGADLIVGVKLWPRSAGTGVALAAEMSKPLVVDIDDPEIETVLEHLRAGPRSSFAMRWNLRHYAPRPSSLLDLRSQVAHHEVTISNPSLGEHYAGTVIPHVRAPRPVGRDHGSERFVVAFPGTPRPHKGLDVLRRAMRPVGEEGGELVVTAPSPPDTAPWERWIGTRGLQETLTLIDDADVVAVPSLDAAASRGQLPVKLIDAMMSGRAIVASDLPAIRWAVGDSAILVAPGSSTELRDALQRLRDPDLRHTLGKAGRQRALKRFTPAAVAPGWRSVLQAAHVR